MNGLLIDGMDPTELVGLIHHQNESVARARFKEVVGP